MNATVRPAAAETLPRICLLSAQAPQLAARLEGLDNWYASQTAADSIDELHPSLDSPMAPSVVVADFRSDPLREFSESDLRDIGRIQARLPQAVIALLTPPLNTRLHRLVQKAGVRHLFTEPIDWEVLSGHLREIARGLRQNGQGGAGPSDDSTLLEICLAMGSTLELTPLMDKILGLMISDMMAHQGSILLFDRDTDRLKMLASRGLPEEIVQKGYIPRKGSIAEWVIDNNQPMVLHERIDDKRFSPISDGREIVSSICLPLRAKGEVQGTINLNRLTPAPRFQDEDLRRATILAAQAALSIENARLYEANLQAERLATVGQTVAAISHSVKGIVTSLRGGISICEQAREARRWEMMDQGWGLVRRNFQRLSNMALEMLDYSKSEREPVCAEFDIETLINEVFSTASARAAVKNAVLSHSIAEDARILCADQEQIFRALLNLLDNAVDAIGEGGRVSVTVNRAAADNGSEIPIPPGPKGGAIFIDVADNGEGINPEEADKIFNAFFSTKGSRGTGLGLPTTQKNIQEHGGRVLVKSAPGEGTTFTIVLPD